MGACSILGGSFPCSSRSSLSCITSLGGPRDVLVQCCVRHLCDRVVARTLGLFERVKCGVYLAMREPSPTTTDAL